MKLFELGTIHGSRIVVDVASGVLYHGQPVFGMFASVVAWIPDNCPNDCFLLAPSHLSRPLQLDSDHDEARVVSLVLSYEPSGSITLRHPLSRKYLCAIVSQEPTGVLMANRTEVGPWEQFTLLPVADVPNDIVTQVGRYLDLVDIIRSVPAAISAIKANAASEDPVELVPLLRLAAPAELDWLGRALGRDQELCRAYASTCKDLWGRLALPALVQDQPADRTRHIDVSLDILASAGLTEGYRSLGQIHNAFARRDRAPAKGLCLVATARNEGLYLLEWLAHHRALGVEAFFLYTNNNDDHSDALLAALAEAGIITWINNVANPGVSPQYKAYGHAFQMLPELVQYRWVGVIDLDEFIVVDKAKYPTLIEFIAARETEPCDAIALNWVMFGPNKQDRWTPAPVTRRFVGREPSVNPHVKSLCRPNKFIHAHCHYPIWDNYEVATLRNASGGLHPKTTHGDGSAFSPHPIDQDAWIAHYFTKSAEEFILRRSFSRGDMGLAVAASGNLFSPAVADLFVSQFNSLQQTTDDRAAACSPDIERDIAELRRLPNVHEAMVGVEQSYKSRLGSLSAVLSTDPRFMAPASNERWFAEILEKSIASRSS